MTKQVTATHAKANLFALLDEVEAGEEIVITRRGRVVAKLRPVRGPLALKGMFAGVVRSNAPDEDLYSTGERWNCEDGTG